MKIQRKLPDYFGEKLAVLIFSIVLMGFSVSLLKEVSFGSDPFTTINQGLVCHLPISFGTSEMLLNAVLLVFIFCVDRKQISIGTVLNMILLGYIADFFTWLWGVVLPVGFFDSFTVRCVIIVPALISFVLSVGGYMAPELGVSAYDATPVYLETKIPLPGKVIRICWDIFYVTVGWLLGATVGVITVVMAFLLGPVIAAVKDVLKKRWSKKKE